MNDPAKVISVACLSDKGRLTIPAEYRRAFKLGRGSALLIMPVGRSLVLVPYDAALAGAAARMEAAMRGQNLSVEDLMEDASEARTEIVRGEFGDLIGDEAAAD